MTNDKTSAVAAQPPTLGFPKLLTGLPLIVIYKKLFDVMLNPQAECPSKQNILIIDKICGRIRRVARF